MSYYTDLKNNEVIKPEECVYCCTKDKMSNIFLSCQHFMINNITRRPILRLEDFGSRWVNYLIKFVLHDNEYTELEYTPSEEINYSMLQSRFQRYFSIVNNNSDIKNELIQCLDKLDSLLTNTESEEPLTLAQKGRIQLKISNNVIKGKQRSKKQYKCSLCGKLGHNSSRSKTKFLLQNSTV